MKKIGSSIHLTPAEEGLVGLSSPVSAEILYSMRQGLHQRGVTLWDQARTERIAMGGIPFSSRFKVAGDVGRALFRGDFGMALRGIRPALEQIRKPDVPESVIRIRELQAESSSYIKLAGALALSETDGEHGRIDGMRPEEVPEDHITALAAELVEDADTFVRSLELDR